MHTLPRVTSHHRFEYRMAALWHSDHPHDQTRLYDAFDRAGCLNDTGSLTGEATAAWFTWLDSLERARADAAARRAGYRSAVEALTLFAERPDRRSWRDYLTIFV